VYDDDASSFENDPLSSSHHHQPPLLLVGWRCLQGKGGEEGTCLFRCAWHSKNAVGKNGGCVGDNRQLAIVLYFV
jgi:hypothetical protein